MADDVAITAGSGTNIAADERTINAVVVKIQRVTEAGASSFTPGQVNVTNTAGGTVIVALRETRKDVTVVNRQTVAVFVGTLTSHFQLDPGDSITIRTTAEVRGITTAAAPAGDRVHYLETHDS